MRPGVHGIALGGAWRQRNAGTLTAVEERASPRVSFRLRATGNHRDTEAQRRATSTTDIHGFDFEVLDWNKIRGQNKPVAAAIRMPCSNSKRRTAARLTLTYR